MNERQAYYKRAPINYLCAALQQPKANFLKVTRSTVTATERLQKNLEKPSCSKKKNNKGLQAKLVATCAMRPPSVFTFSLQQLNFSLKRRAKRAPFLNSKPLLKNYAHFSGEVRGS